MELKRAYEKIEDLSKNQNQREDHSSYKAEIARLTNELRKAI